MKFLTDLYASIKKRYIRRIWIASIGGATTASVYLAGVAQSYLMERVPQIVAFVPGDALAGVIFGVFVSLITWGFSLWLGKPIAQLQAEFGLEQTGIAGEKFQDAITDAINCPSTFAMRNADGIEIRKPRIIEP